MSDFAPLPMSAADASFNSARAADYVAAYNAAYVDVLRLGHRKPSPRPVIVEADYSALENRVRAYYGLTAIPPPPPQSWWRRLWHRFKELAKN